MNDTLTCLLKKNNKFSLPVFDHFLHLNSSQSFRIIAHLKEQISLYKTVYMTISWSFIIKKRQIQNWISYTNFPTFFSRFFVNLSCNFFVNCRGTRNFFTVLDTVNQGLSNEYKIFEIQVATSLHLRLTKYSTTMSIIICMMITFFSKIRGSKLNYTSSARSRLDV